MAHCLNAVIARRELVEHARCHFPGIEPVQLEQGLAMLRLPGREPSGPSPRTVVADGFHYLATFAGVIISIGSPRASMLGSA